MTRLKHYRKQLLRPGTFTDESGRKVSFDETIVRRAVEQLNRAIADGVAVPVVLSAGKHPTDLHESTPNIQQDARYVGKLDLAAWQAGWLTADLDTGDKTLPDDAAVSVWIEPRVTVGGKEYSPMIRHVLVTDEPAVSGQSEMVLLRNATDYTVEVGDAELPAGQSVLRIKTVGRSPSILFPAARLALHHNSVVAKNEPDWGSVDKAKLPQIAFADHGKAGEKSTWSYPHHWVQGGTVGPDGVYETAEGEMYLHEGGLNAAWAAAQGARSGEKAGAEVIAHLEAHRRALGLDKQDSAKMTKEPQMEKPLADQIRARLGVAAESKDEEVLAALDAKLKAPAPATEEKKPEEKKEPELPDDVKLRLSQAEGQIRDMHLEKFEHELDKLTSVEGRITPAVRDKVKALFPANYGAKLRAGDGKTEQPVHELLLSIFRELPEHHVFDEKTAKLRIVPGLQKGDAKERVQQEIAKTRAAAPALAVAGTK